MGEPEAAPVAPPGAGGPEAMAVLEEAGPVLARLTTLAADEALPADLREDAAHATAEARARLAGDPVVLDVLGVDTAAARAWVRRWLTAAVGEGAAGLALDVRWAADPALRITGNDGAVATLEDRSPDPGPALEAEQAELGARARDVAEALRRARAELEATSAKVLERTTVKAEVEADLDAAREALDARATAKGEADDAVVAADAYLRACESTVPAVLRAPPKGLLAQVLHAVLPLLYGQARRAWVAAVEGRAARVGGLEAATAALAAATDDKARLQRRRVAVMNELHRLKGEGARLREEVAALEAEGARVAARLADVRAALEARPEARRAAWATQVRVAVADEAVAAVDLAGPDVRLPRGLVLRVAPDALGPAGDVSLLLPGAAGPELAERVTPVTLVVGGPEALPATAAAVGLRRDDVWAVSDAIADGRALRAAAGRASLLGTARRLVARAERLDGAVGASLAATGRAREERGRRLAALTAFASEGWTREAVASAGLGADVPAVLAALGGPVAEAVAAAREATARPLHDASDAVGMREASQHLASALQRGVDKVRRDVARALVEQATAVVERHRVAARAPLDAALAEAGVVASRRDPTRLRLPPVVPTVDVAPDAGRLGGPLLRLRSVDNLRGEALAGLRSAADQAGLQLQARLHTAAGALIDHLVAALAERVEADRRAFHADVAAALAAHDASAASAAADAERLAGLARGLRAHAHALGEATRDLRL
jgi:hypothetical protein